jgi:hypothetical protein
MTSHRASARTLRILVRLFALNAVATGLACVVFGPGLLSGSGSVIAPDLAQEFRFLSVWWLAVGVYLWMLAARAHAATAEFRMVCVVLFASGVARWVTFATHGWPAPLFVMVATIEIAAPAPLWWLQARVASRQATRLETAVPTPARGHANRSVS